MLPIRDGAGTSLSRSLPSWAGSVGSVRLSLVLSLILRSGESCGGRKPSRTGRNRSDVTVWAAAWVLSKVISARHANSARNVIARLRRPVAGPDITMEIPQQIHTLADQIPARRRAAWKTSLTDLKQLWLMSR